MQVEALEDGRKEITLRQSWLNTFFNCPELARREAFEGLESVETDATAIGTAMHAGAELAVTGAYNYKSCLDYALSEFERLAPEVRWVQVKRKDTALQYVQTCFDTWWADVRPLLGEPLGIEHTFNVVLWEDDDYVVRLSGTMDFVDDLSIIWDWKSAANADKYGRNAWEHKRWSIQPTVYTYAWWVETGEVVPFTFAACLKGFTRRPAQFVTVTRDQTHWDWLGQQIRPIIDLWEADLKVWPLRDQHVLCSPKWCPAWDTCKGQAVTLP